MAGPSGPAFLYNFYPRSPCGERLYILVNTFSKFFNFYPRSPCGERHETTPYIVWETQISIHALLAESDTPFEKFEGIMVTFLSTLSLRRATNCGPYHVKRHKISIHALLAESDRLCRILYSCPGNFYPRSPCGERRLNLPSSPIDKNISIHALLAESDLIISIVLSTPPIFLSTLSLRRATCSCCFVWLLASYFYPRSPQGERG